MILSYPEVGTLGINSGMDSFLICSHKVCKTQNIQLCFLKCLWFIILSHTGWFENVCTCASLYKLAQSQRWLVLGPSIWKTISVSLTYFMSRKQNVLSLANRASWLIQLHIKQGPQLCPLITNELASIFVRHLPCTIILIFHCPFVVNFIGASGASERHEHVWLFRFWKWFSISW